MSKARGLADLGNVYSDGALSNRNVILNGAMNVAQRGTSFTGGGFTLDRWTVATGGAGAIAVTQEAFTLGQTDVPNEPKNYMRATLTGTPPDPQIVQPVEDVQTLAGQTCTLSFWAKADSAKTFSEGGYFGQQFGAGGSSAVYTNMGAWSVTTSWQKITITTTLPSISGKTVGSGNHLQVRLDPNNNETVVLDIANVQLEVGDTATPFEHRSYGQELALCQRFYETGRYYVQATSVSGSLGTTATFKLSKRAAPTVTFANLTGVIGGIASTGLDSVRSYGSVGASSQVQYDWTADAEL